MTERFYAKLKTTHGLFTTRGQSLYQSKLTLSTSPLVSENHWKWKVFLIAQALLNWLPRYRSATRLWNWCHLILYVVFRASLSVSYIVISLSGRLIINWCSDCLRFKTVKGINLRNACVLNRVILKLRRLTVNRKRHKKGSLNPFSRRYLERKFRFYYQELLAADWESVLNREKPSMNAREKKQSGKQYTSCS